MCGFGFLTPLQFGLHLSLCKAWGLYNYFPPNIDPLFPPLFPPSSSPLTPFCKKSCLAIHFTSIWSLWESHERSKTVRLFFVQCILCSSKDLCCTLIRTIWNSNNDYDLSLWIGEQQCIQMNFWQFFRNANISVIPGKLWEIHWHTWLFSDRRERSFFFLKVWDRFVPKIWYS